MLSSSRERGNATHSKSCGVIEHMFKIALTKGVTAFKTAAKRPGEAVTETENNDSDYKRDLKMTSREIKTVLAVAPELVLDHFF